MWTPGNAAELEDAVRAGQLEETHTFDGKRLPSKSRDIAIDVCAMTVDGGSLVYGIGEDNNKRLTELHPLSLAGERERIDQIVQTSIHEPPTTHVVADASKPTSTEKCRPHSTHRTSRRSGSAPMPASPKVGDMPGSDGGRGPGDQVVERERLVRRWRRKVKERVIAVV